MLYTFLQHSQNIKFRLNTHNQTTEFGCLVVLLAKSVNRRSSLSGAGLKGLGCFSTFQKQPS